MFSHPTKQDVLIKAYDYSKPADEWMFGCFTNNLPFDHMTFNITDEQMFRCFHHREVRCFAQSI